MKRFGLIGYPIRHSLSPSLFKAAYSGVYGYDLIENEDFDKAYEIFLEGYEGVNVTAPFKEKAFIKADSVSEECRIIKATNLLVKTPQGVMAYNSDYLGVRMWLQGLPLPDNPGQTVMIAGCGGAGKAAAVAAASAGHRVMLLNRDIRKAEALADSISQMENAPCVQVRPLDEFGKSFKESDIIIYNIPSAIPQLISLSKDEIAGAEGKGAKHILEANYMNPSFTGSMLADMISYNPEIRYTPGRTWLLYQAVTGYEIFTGQKPDLALMYGVL